MNNAKAVALSLYAMQNIVKSGLDCSGASMVYHPVSEHSDVYQLQVKDFEHTKEFWDTAPRNVVTPGYFSRKYGRDIPAFTADDILKFIKESIIIGGLKCVLTVTKLQSEYRATYAGEHENGYINRLVEWSAPTLLNLLEQILLWHIECKLLPT